MDTNILLRGAQPSHPLHADAVNAQITLRKRGDQPCIVAQNLIEFRAVATRPAAVNGLGMTQPQAAQELIHLKALYPLFREAPEILAEWERLVSVYGAEGKQNHDARLVAAMIVHSIPAVLTFNRDDFTRYAEITVFTPQAVLTSTGSP
jgi:predicted nucleic acid-binding protein